MNTNEDSFHEPPSNKIAKGSRGVHIKMLIPAKVAGIVIGKGGANINKLQDESNAKIKISKSHELFPGTDERVCLVNGDIEGVLQVYDNIQDTFQSRPDAVSSDLSSDRINEVQLLVPNTTAGLLIGKGGTNVKQISQETGAKIIISQRVDGVPERLVVISSTSDNSRRHAFDQVITKIRDDPHHDSCADIFYAHQNDSRQSRNRRSSPLPPSIHNNSRHSSTSAGSAIDIIDGLLAEAGGLNPGNADILLSIMNERFNLHGDAAIDVLKSVDCLGSYGLLSSQPEPISNNHNNSRYSPPTPHGHPSSLSRSSESSRKHVQIRVPSRIVGALVGPGGRSLAALEARCGGASVHISPRDDRASERVVTIEAPYSDVLERALEMINNIVSREEARHNRRSFD
ncbi:hypothetical protein GJ496_011024 [Pomphorhynchus laevis]|nr:hypothetical protein GJ496_011024 [Pomphorhynchus laevis]